MIDLNDAAYGGSSVFNEGKGGLVEEVTIDVSKKESTGMESDPDYKLLISDSNNRVLEQWFYYFSPQETKTEEQNKAKEGYEISRVVSLAKAVMGADYKLPAVSNSKEAFDVIFKLVKENCGDKKFNVFVTYGTKDYPKAYLNLRYFNFIESADGPNRLSAKPADLLEKVTPDSDEPSELDEMEGSVNKTNDATEEWVS